ncbi:MAG TPA: transglycosylase domain-containing protein, partial [Candidatus Limnocylindrales bacterium]
VVWLKITAVVVLLLAIVVLGVAAGAIFALSRNLPSLEDLRKRPNAVNTTIYDRHGILIAELHGDENRVLVTSKGIPEVMKQATVATEDARFYTHHGVDFQGVLRAVVENIRAGGVVQGGSTITEQYVKNAYVGNERTYTRKIREAILAWQLEDKWSKDKILTEYLNTVYYGAGAYGVEAASRTYFHKPAAKLKLQQAALLAALPKFPSEYSPTTDPKIAKERRNIVLQVMAEQGYITTARAASLSKSKLGVFKHPESLNQDLASYFTDYVTRVLTKRYGTRQVFEGGLKVYTSIDMAWQAEATDIIKSTTGPLDFGFKPSAALVAIDPKNGYIRTMVGGLDYKKQKFNLAWQAKRQAGSAMKPFVLATGVEQGMNPDSTYYPSKSPIIIPMGLYAAPWVVNGDGPGGPESVAAATTISDNVVFAQLSVDVGPENTVDTAHRMGITSPLEAVPSITLGTSGVSPLEMADAYATLASGGVHHQPQAIVKVELPNGRVDWRPKTTGNRAIPTGVASVVTQCLERAAAS